MYKAYLNSNLRIESDDENMIFDLREYAQFKYEEETRRGGLSIVTPMIKRCFVSNSPNEILLPSGCFDYVVKTYGSPEELVDSTAQTPANIGDFMGDLRKNQLEVYDQISGLRYFSIQAETGFGKSIFALAIIAIHQMKTLIILPPNSGLLTHWKSEIQRFLPNAKVGLYGDGNKELEGCDIVVALKNSIMANLELFRDQGFAICVYDEAHNLGENQYLPLITSMNPFMRVGLTATPYRYDSLEPLIKYYVGDIAAVGEHDNPPRIYFTEVHSNIEINDYSITNEFKAWESALYLNQDRYKPVVDVVKRQCGLFNHKMVVVVGRREAAYMVADMIRSDSVPTEVYIGETATQQILDDFESGKVKCLVATDSMIGEGVNLPKMNGLFNPWWTSLKRAGHLL